MSTNGASGRFDGTRGYLLGLLIDAVLVVCWIVAITLAFRLTDWSVTAYYVVVFGGIIVYSLVIEPWALWKRR